VHFPGSAVKASGALFGAPGRTARLAAFGVVNEPARVEELLLTYSESELSAAVYAYESPV
jgi:hypothetical protein